MKIFINIFKEGTIILDVEPNDIIKYVKSLIEEKEKILINKQILIFHGQVLDDNCTLMDYNIHRESKLHLIIEKDDQSSYIMIYINLLGKKKISIIVNINDKILDLKKEIENNEKIDIDEQNLFFCGALLEDEKLINDYKIENNDIIICVVFEKYLNIKYENKILKIRYNELDYVSDLRELVSKKSHIDFYDKKFEYNNKIMDDDKKLKEYNIPNKSTIEIITVPKGDKLILRLRSGTYAVERNTNLDITKESKYSKMNQILINKVIELEQMLNNEKNKNNNIKESIAVLFSSTDNKIHYPMICKTSDIFEELVEKLYEAYPEYKERENIFLINGNIVDKNKNITDNKIKDHDTIILSVV